MPPDVTSDEFKRQLAAQPTAEPFTLSNPEVSRKRDEFAHAHKAAFAIRDKYDGKPGGMTSTERAEFETALTVAEGCADALKLSQKWAGIQKFSETASNALPMGKPSVVSTDDGVSEDIKRYNAAHMKAYRKYLSVPEGCKSLSDFGRFPEVQAFNKLEMPDDEAFKTYHKNASIKAYQAENPAGFGFAVPPQELITAFITLMKDIVYIRAAATKYSIPRAESLGVPAIDTDPAYGTWTAELAVGNEETTVATGKRELRPHPLAKYIKESKKLLRQVPNVEGVIMDRLAYIMGLTEENAFLNGSGADQPLGIFVNSTYGIGTASDTTAAGTGSTTAIASDDVVNTFYSLKAQYRREATWIMHRNVVQKVRLFKDTTNNYIWTAGYGVLQGLGPGGGLQETPDTLMGRPIFESEIAPNTFTTGLYMMAVGSLRHYWIADALDMQIQVLYELFALNNQMGYILRREVDGMPVLSEAFARLHLA